MKKTVTTRAIAIGLTIGLLGAGSVFAAEEVASEPAESLGKNIGFDIALGVEAVGGDTTYSIGGPVTTADGSVDSSHFPFSKLEWPLDIWLARLDATVNIGSSWRINGVLKKKYQ